MRQLILTAVLMTLVACGGGGSPTSPPPTGGGTGTGTGTGSGTGTGTGTGGGTGSSSGPTVEELEAAALILDLTTFGATYDEIESVARLGTEGWLDNQLATAPSLHEPITRRYGAEYGYEPGGLVPRPLYRRFAFFERALTAPDQLRQLTAYALSQLFVVSQTGQLQNNPLGLASFYDTLLVHSFGNFEDLLRAVSLHPAMGFYLSHVNNGKTNLDGNTFPDENYAREVMQLFTIGLYELNPDGSRVLDGDGRPIPTYDNDDIQEFAKIFTGLGYDDIEREPSFGRQRGALHLPMIMFDEYHEPGKKYLLNGFVVPEGQTGLQDIDDAVSNLFNHPNVGPFVGKQLIQRLVTSNPSPEYVARITAVFNDNGDGVRGDMSAVIRAILTDEEVAQAIRVREPFRRFVAVNRSLHAAPLSGTDYGATGQAVEYLTGQMVHSAPSVFNFYSPFYRPQGGQGLISPEMQITTEDTAIGMTNLMAFVLYEDQSMNTHPEFADINIDLSEFIDLADDEDAFLTRMDLLFFAGQMSSHTEQVIRDVLDAASSYSALERARVGLYAGLIAPDQAVMEGEGL